MADSLIEAELLAACSGLGYSDGSRYYKEADCLETIKDLIRYLKRDDDSHHIRRALGETKVLQTDLIFILKFYAEDKELFDVTLRLVVNLTNPVLLLFKEELPEEKITRQQYLQMIGHQQSFKAAFADEAVWSILVGRLGEILNKDWEEREEEERLVIERILLLVRNVLAVAANPDDEKRTDDDASIHDQVLWALHLARFEDLLLYISSSNNEQDLCLHVIEIISKMLKEQDASQLANAGIQRSQTEKEKDEKELMEIRRREALAKQQKVKKHYSARHSRFGGTYYVMNMKSISERDMIAHKHVTDIESLSFDQSKKSKKTPKNRMPLKDCDITRRSTLAIRLFLQEFCIEFLNGAFNSLMYIVKDNLNRARAQEHDEIYYLWAIEFFLKFNRSHNFKIELITEVLNIQTFHYIQTLMENYYETMTTDKKKIPLWSRRMHKGLKAYQELLMTLSFMDKSNIESVRESSRILKNKVFYVVEYRELPLILMQNFDELKMTMNYLRDLVETTHVFLKLLEGICGKQRHLIVQKKKIKKAKPKKKSVNKDDSLALPTEEELVIQWDEKSDALLSVIKGDMGELPATFPYDPVSDTSEEEQKEISMKKVNLLLRRGEFHEAISLLRTSREIWPDGDIFGAENMDPLEESLCLRTIFMANINPPEPKSHVTEEEEIEEDSDEEQERQEIQLSEQEFDLVGFIRRFGHIKVLQAYCLLFKNFFTNGENVNHCILKLFHRLAQDCKMVAIFFQASLFKTFLKIFDGHDKSVRSHIDAINFAKFVFKKFVQTAEENKKVFMELLFWKTNKDALEIECGYGTSEVEKKDTTRAAWTEEEEDELRRLYEEFKDVQSEDKDIVDLISDNLINRNRTRRAVIKKLKDLYIISNVKELHKKTVKVRESKQWSEEQIAELRSLVEEFKDAVHPIQRILDHMTIKRPKNRVVDKIMELGLVENRKELQKKRTGSSSRNRKTGENFLNANAASDDESDNQEEDEETFERGHEMNPKDSDNSSDEEESSSIKIKSRERICQPTLPTPGLINSRLTKVLDEGWREAVEWISNLLAETADERESDGDFEPIPLITITSITSRAMEDESFLDLLKVIGVHPPKNQEMFWRIPSNISIDGLRKRARYLKQGLNGELTDVPSSQEESSAEAVDSQETRSFDVNKDNKDFEESMDSSIHDEIGRDETVEDSNMEQTSQVLQNVENILENRKRSSSDNKRNKRKKKRILLDDEDENEESLRLHLDTEPTQKYDKERDENRSDNKKRRIIIDDDDDNEESLQLHIDTEDTQEQISEVHIKSRIYDSDEDSEEVLVKPRKNSSQFKAILDDSDED